MNKGIVMEVDASDIIVMTAEGRFAKIPLEKRTCQIGEEIYFSELKSKRRRPLVMTGSFVAIAAAILLLLFNLNFSSTAMTNKQIVAYVSIDINPSVEMGIDEHNIVLELRGLNPDGVELIKNFDFAGKNVDNLTEDLLQKAEYKYLSKGEGDIIISSTMRENGNVDSKVNDIDLSAKLKEVAVQHIAKVHPEQKANYQVTAFAADKEVRKVGNSKGLSAGKYTIYLNAKNKGQDTTIDDLKKESVHSIAKKLGGIDKFVEVEDLSKDKTNKLMNEDKNGELDRKLSKLKSDLKNNAAKNEAKKNEVEKNESNSNSEKKQDEKNKKIDDLLNSTDSNLQKDNKSDNQAEKSGWWFNKSSSTIPSLTPTPSSIIEATIKPWDNKASPTATPEPTTVPQDDGKKEKETNNNQKKNKDNRKQRD